jgi:mono/diheme cytochrome c family protein
MQAFTALGLGVGLLLGCGQAGTTLTGEGPDGSFPIQGPDPNGLLDELTDAIFTDDPGFSDSTPSDGSGGNTDTPASDDVATPPPDDTGDAANPPPDPEPEPEPEPFPGDATYGQALYRLNCQECHGADAVGGSAPGIRGASVAEINVYINGRNRHPRFGGLVGFTADDVQDIAAYLNSL